MPFLPTSQNHSFLLLVSDIMHALIVHIFEACVPGHGRSGMRRPGENRRGVAEPRKPQGLALEVFREAR